MACAVASTSSLGNALRTNSTVTAPASIANGDILVYGLQIGNYRPTPTATPPTGFAAWTGIPVNWGDDGAPDDFSNYIYFWYKVASSESGNYTATHSESYSNAFMWRITGGDTTTPNDQAATSATKDENVGTGKVLTAPTQTPTVDGCALLWIGGSWDAFGAASPTGGWTERYNVTTESFYAQDLIQETAGATGGITVNSTQNDFRANGCVMVCVRAAVGGAQSGLPNSRGVDSLGTLFEWLGICKHELNAIPMSMIGRRRKRKHLEWLERERIRLSA